jgi:hypothetical protein
MFEMGIAVGQNAGARKGRKKDWRAAALDWQARGE